jgi:leucyl-tRNA synthetase
MDYNFKDIEQKWRTEWSRTGAYKTGTDKNAPKFYVLDMFPYPSGAGLHVGHPLGYIASDIYARYKRHKGFNVLHPMGYDAFGLPAEQYAIQTGQHPAITTETNIKRYREQLDLLGFSFDWDREVRTCDPSYYKWTQWVFVQLFQHWYNNATSNAAPIEELIKHFETRGSDGIDAAYTEHEPFSAETWKQFNEKEQQEMLMNYRLAYLADTAVNWCPALGTVLANDEVSEGLSVRGGHPVERKLMRQWLLRITAYASRLLNDLEDLEWSDPLKEIQRNWIGRSEGASVDFSVKNHDLKITVFTTRPDTIFGVSYMTLAPEHEMVAMITTPAQKQAVEAYVTETKNRTERERMAEVNRISGVFTGAYAIHPFSGAELPVWVGDYVLAGYGSGAVMAVPAHDSRDYAFATYFGLQIKEVVAGGDLSQSSYDAKEGILINSDFLNGLSVQEAITTAITAIEKKQLGEKKINYRLRDAIFSRQRYWGEPFPVYYRDGMPYMLDVSELPLQLPEVDAYLPTETGEPPLARAKNWVTKEGYPLETNTMPGFAGSSGYYLRYMDPSNEKEFFSKESVNYWENVDLYIGGAEHATGHLLYARFWNKFLFDLGLSVKQEPFKKLINQGMIQGRSSIVYREKGKKTFISLPLIGAYETTALHVDVSLDNDILDIDAFKKWRPEFADHNFVMENGKFQCGSAIEKMSKSLYNVVNPDALIEKYGADTLRLYEMFLGPIEMHKPWDTKGIEGVFRFIRKLWKLYHDADNNLNISDEKAAPAELKILHKTIKKIQEDIERFSFNTSVSAFMICVNELAELKCNKREILNEIPILLSPFAPHIAEELWHLMGNHTTVTKAPFPTVNQDFLTENTFSYPVSINGKMRFKIELPVDMGIAEIQQEVSKTAEYEKWVGTQPVKKCIIVPKKIINIVI